MSKAPLDNQHPDLFGQTPSQTVGPFFHYALPWEGGADLVGSSDMGARPELFPKDHHVLNRSRRAAAPAGEPIEIEGYVLDGEGKPVPDAMIEIWQADAAGHYDDDFTGFGRSATGEDGRYAFRSIRPGSVPGPAGAMQAPHIAMSVFARGLLDRLVTRLYFADAEENAVDPVLRLIPEERRHTLLATRQDSGCWRLDIRLQGPDETVFFAL